MGTRQKSEVPCPLCGGQAGELVYRRSFESEPRGRIELQLVLCACGFLFAAPGPRLAIAPDDPADPGAPGRSHTARFLAERVAFVDRLLAERSTPGRVLDVGAAGGELLRALNLEAWEREGLEPARPAASLARSRALLVHEVTLEEHGLAPASYDLVTCFDVLPYVADPLRAMTALEELVRPGGVLVVGVPDAARPECALSEFYAFDRSSHFTRGTLLTLARRHGFAPLRIEASPGPRLTVGFRQVGRAAAAKLRVRGDRAALRAAILRYAKERSALEGRLAAHLEHCIARWRTEGNRVAIYGAGEHTWFLFDLVDFGECVVGILDSDPAKHGRPFRRWRICSPFEAPMIGADTVLVSSKPFQEEMVAALGPLVRAHGLHVERCYPEQVEDRASAA